MLQDDEHETKGTYYEPSDHRDFSKVRREAGVISYRIYGQDGVFIDMTCADTYGNCMLVSWIQIHDRYSRPQKGL